MAKKERKSVAVVFGGPSFEHEISILTGVFALNVLKRSEYDVLPVWISLDGEFFSSGQMFSVSAFSGKKKFARVHFGIQSLWRGDGRKKIADISAVLNCCHGGFGEGGGLAALCELYRLPLASPACAPSALFMDKIWTKSVLSALSIPSAPYTTLSESDYRRDEEGAFAAVQESLSFPVVIKPARLGSSIGVGVARNKEEWKEKLETAFRFDCDVLIEKYIEGKRDINCAAYALDGKIAVSRCEEPYSREEIFSFGEKYLTEGKQRRSRIPADIPPEAEEEIRRITEKVYRAARLSGVVRADFLYADGKVYFNEMNTVPGSLAYYLFSEKITSARKLFCSLVEEAILRDRREEKAYALTGVLQKVETGRKK